MLALIHRLFVAIFIGAQGMLVELNTHITIRAGCITTPP
jgi:hypothetical protein